MTMITAADTSDITSQLGDYGSYQEPCADKAGTYNSMSALTKDYEIISELGTGTYGKVFKATHRTTKTDVAIKLIENCFEDNYNARKVISEI